MKAKLFLDLLEDDVKMETTGFLADIMLHLNDLNVKLQEKKSPSFQLNLNSSCISKKLALFATDIRCQLLNCPKLLEQQKGDRLADIKYVHFIEKLIDNFIERFDDFVLKEQLVLFIQNPFNLTNMTEFLMEAKLTFKWMDVAKIQLEIIDFQENVSLKQAFCDCTPENFWASRVSNVNFPALFQLAVQIFATFGSTYCCESAFTPINFVKYKFRISMTRDVEAVIFQTLPLPPTKNEKTTVDNFFNFYGSLAYFLLHFIILRRQKPSYIAISLPTSLELIVLNYSVFVFLRYQSSC